MAWLERLFGTVWLERLFGTFRSAGEKAIWPEETGKGAVETRSAVEPALRNDTDQMHCFVGTGRSWTTAVGSWAAEPAVGRAGI